MEIRIGVRNVAREIVIESDQTADEVNQAVAAALEGGKALTLKDDKGHTVVVPADALGYLDIGSEQERRVGFGS